MALGKNSGTLGFLNSLILHARLVFNFRTRTYDRSTTRASFSERGAFEILSNSKKPHSEQEVQVSKTSSFLGTGKLSIGALLYKISEHDFKIKYSCVVFL